MRHHLHWELDTGPDDVVEVVLSGPANAMLLDSTNYERYRRWDPFEYHGGFAEDSPFEITPPHPGRWDLVVDLGGYTAHVRAGGRVVQKAAVPTR